MFARMRKWSESAVQIDQHGFDNYICACIYNGHYYQKGYDCSFKNAEVRAMFKKFVLTQEIEPATPKRDGRVYLNTSLWR
jgi:hypothetical protein